MDLRKLSAPKLFAVAVAVSAAIAASVASLAPSAVAQETSLVSVRADGKQADRDCNPAALSFDGRYAAFVSDATTLAGLTTHFVQCYVKDRVSGTLELVSRNASGVEANADVHDVRISPDGNFVVFATLADNLDATDTNHRSDCYLVDRAAQTIERVSIGPDGELGDGDSFQPIVSADGRYVCFSSIASNFEYQDDNGSTDVFLRDRLLYETYCLSLTPDGHVGNGPSIAGDMTSDATQVVFASEAHDLTDVQTVGDDIFVRDVASATTTLISLEMDGSPANGCEDPRCSADGSVVCFKSSDAQLVPDDHDTAADVFVLDRTAGTIERANLTNDGSEAGGAEYGRISADGRMVGFSGGPLDPGDTNGVPDGYARDRLRHRTFRVDVRDGGDQTGMVGGPAIPSGDGHAFLFGTPVKMVEEGDINSFADVFVHELAPTLATSSHYGAGFPGELGIPTLTPGGDPTIGGPVDVTVGSSSSSWILGFLAVGVTSIDARGSWGGDLLVAPLALIPVPVTPFGYTFHGAIPYDASYWGVVIELQALELDPQAAKGISSTDGLELDLGN